MERLTLRRELKATIRRQQLQIKPIRQERDTWCDIATNNQPNEEPPVS